MSVGDILLDSIDLYEGKGAIVNIHQNSVMHHYDY